MTDVPRKQNPAPRRASSETLAIQRDKVVREQIEKERTASTAKTARLRALRLAKEVADKEDAQQRASEKATPSRTGTVRAKRVRGSEPSD